MGKGCSRFFTAILLTVTKWFPTKSSEDPVSINVFAGTPLMFMVANIGGGFCSDCSGCSKVVFVDNAIVGTFGTIETIGLPSNASRYVLPSIVGLDERLGLLGLAPCDSDTRMEFDSGTVVDLVVFFVVSSVILAEVSFFVFLQSDERCPFSKQLKHLPSLRNSLRDNSFLGFSDAFVGLLVSSFELAR